MTSTPEPTEADQTSLRRINRWQVEKLREDLADLYVESVQTAPGQEYRGRQAFLDRLAADVRQPGFDMILAEGDSVVACACGYPVARDGQWWQGIQPTLPVEIEQLTASGHVLAVTEILVHPTHQHRGLAGRLLQRLLDDHEASLAATQVEQDDSVARAAFQSWGWDEIGEIHRPPDATILLALIHPIGERAADDPHGLAHNPQTQRPERSPDAI